jgi:hypothetical protein
MKEFSWILRCHQIRTISITVFSKNAYFHSAYLPKMWNSTSLNTLRTVKNTQFYNALLAKTLRFTLPSCQKCSLRSENVQLQRWRLVSLHVFSDTAQLCYALSVKTGTDRKFWISRRTWKRFLNVFVILCLASLNDWMMQKRVKNRLWKSLTCVPLN